MPRSKWGVLLGVPVIKEENDLETQIKMDIHLDKVLEFNRIEIEIGDISYTIRDKNSEIFLKLGDGKIQYRFNERDDWMDLQDPRVQVKPSRKWFS